MKLIRCYIENFGGLQQYTADFDEGLTVICEPNGFGKTTLAEFIRAMFYGFPRANKDLQKNPRLKYLPWQGGRYGGYLIFEHQGKRYRIDRSFGEAPKGDKFKLFDEDTHKESRDFTADIGTELFGLDSEAFLRSTYMPQIRDSGSLSTDSIRAKLGNLLEDTGDMGSYEKALQRLREKRTAYEHYRGTGGSIHELGRRMTQLQTDISSCQSSLPLLEQTDNEITELRQAQALGEGALAHIRKELTAANTAQAEAALSREYEGLVTKQVGTAAQLQALRERYPKGMPTAPEAETVAAAMDRAATLMGSLQETPADRNAAQTIRDHRDRFAKGVPTESDLDAAAQALDTYNDLRTELRSAALSQAEAEQLDSLHKQFREGTPDEAWFETCRERQGELSRLEANAETLHLSEDDAKRLQDLDRFFAEGVPDQADLDRHSKQLERAEQLRRENLRLAAVMPTEEPAPTAPAKKLHSLFLPALILGILAAAAGVYLLTADTVMANQMLIGGISAAAAVVALILACFLQINHNINAKLTAAPAVGMTQAQRSLLDENEAEAAALESDTAAFLAPYPAEADATLTRQLSELQTKRELYLPLRERARQLEAQKADTDRRIAELNDALTSALQPYFFRLPPFDAALRQLESRVEQYRGLEEKQQAAETRCKELEAKLDALDRQLRDFLAPYSPTVPTDYRAALTALGRDRDSYLNAVALVQHREEALAKRDEALAAVTAQIDAFAAAYGPELGITDRQALNSITRDMEAAQRLEAEAETAAAALEAFLREHGPKPASALPEVLPDPNALKLAEREQLRKQSELNSRLVRLEQKRRQLREELDRIPALTDELTRCTEQKAAETENRRLLDTTIDYLQKARESLSASYLGGVQGHFARYLSRLTGEQAGTIAVNTDLEVQLERAGSPRALGHFSAGQTDAIHLCMRLALSDALFEDGKCFMVLDDPFVNLDDKHTAEALSLLQDLAQDRQIIYLVCNTSRSI